MFFKKSLGRVNGTKTILCHPMSQQKVLQLHFIEVSLLVIL